MRKKIGRLANKILRPLGYTIQPIVRIIPLTRESNWGERLNIKTIIDIGSNEGQFIREINSILPGRKILAFEPISSCYRKLVDNTTDTDITAFNVGLSDHQGTTEINISNNLYSSSILEMEELHRSSYPDSHFIKKEKIELRRLDDVLAEIHVEGNILIKMDVQGYEEKVILGGQQTFAKAAAVIVESTFESLYGGQWLFDDLYRHFTDMGFRFMGFADQIHSKRSGIPLYADSIFIKKELIPLVM
jgi:FkbM family methyltransferase